MPTVRKAARQVSLTALPGVRLTAAPTAISEGAGVAEAEAGVGRAIAGIGDTIAGAAVAGYERLEHQRRRQALEAKQRADQLALINAETRLAQWERDRLYDPEQGALTIKGKDSFALPEQIDAEFTAQAGEVERTLTTPEQKAGFARIRAAREQQIALSIRRHVYGEMQAYEASELKARVETSTDLAIANFKDPRRVGQELQRAVDAIQNAAPRLGLGKAQVEQAIAQARSAVHVGIIDRMLANDQARAAQVYFEEAKGQIEGDRIAAIEKALEAGGLRKTAQEAADRIIATGGTLTEQREAARAIAEPKVRDEVMQRIEHEAAVTEKIERDTHEQLVKGAFDVLDRTGSVRSIPTNVWTQLSAGERSAAWSYARQRAEGIPVKTDQATFYALMSQAGDDPAEFVTQNLLHYRARLSDADFQQLTGLQLSVKTGKKNQDDVLAGFATKQEIMDHTLAAYGIDPKAKPDTAEGKAIAQLYRMLDRRVDVLQAPDAKGKTTKIANTEIQQVLDELLGQGVDVPGSWWSAWPGGRPGPWGTERKRLIELTVDDIPPTIRRQIEDKLRARKKPVTPATILDVYLETQVK